MRLVVHVVGSVVLSREAATLVQAACLLEPTDGGNSRLLALVDSEPRPAAPPAASDLSTAQEPIQLHALQVKVASSSPAQIIHNNLRIV